MGISGIIFTHKFIKENQRVAASMCFTRAKLGIIYLPNRELLPRFKAKKTPEISPAFDSLSEGLISLSV
jgi:hypothetical protein